MNGIWFILMPIFLVVALIVLAAYQNEPVTEKSVEEENKDAKY